MTLLAVRESGPVANRVVEEILLAQGAAFDVSGDVAFNSAFVDPGGYRDSPDGAPLELTDIFSIERPSNAYQKMRGTLQDLKTLIGGGSGGDSLLTWIGL
jgi:hypothetical protein